MMVIYKVYTYSDSNVIVINAKQTTYPRSTEGLQTMKPSGRGCPPSLVLAESGFLSGNAAVER